MKAKNTIEPVDMSPAYVAERKKLLKRLDRSTKAQLRLRSWLTGREIRIKASASKAQARVRRDEVKQLARAAKDYQRQAAPLNSEQQAISERIAVLEQRLTTAGVAF